MAETLAVTFLGTRDAAFGPGTFTSSQLVSLGETDVLVDAGAGSSSQLRRAGLAVAELEAIVLTHWHPDHVAGLPPLLRRGGGRLTKRSSLRLFGPSPPSNAWWHALRGAAAWPLVASLDVVEPGDVLELGALRLETYPTDHGTRSVGWRFHEARGGDRIVVIPGDSRPTEEIADAARGADLLVFEATFLDEHRDRALASRHSTAWEAGSLARAAGCGTLALTHLSSRYAREEVADEARLAFDRIVVPRDLDRLEVGPRAGAAHGPVTLHPAARG
jgi:ribonuclease Z